MNFNQRLDSVRAMNPPGESAAFSPALRAGHQAAAADGHPREQARASARR